MNPNMASAFVTAKELAEQYDTSQMFGFLARLSGNLGGDVMAQYVVESMPFFANKDATVIVGSKGWVSVKEQPADASRAKEELTRELRGNTAVQIEIIGEKILVSQKLPCGVTTQVELAVR
jgi:hypothetical protein